MGAEGRLFLSRGHYPIRLWRDLLFLTHRFAAVDVAVVSEASIAGAAAVAASAAGMIAAVVARIFAVGRIAVEVAPVAFAAAWSAPAVRRKQGKQATQRTAMPGPGVAAVAARIGAGIAAGVAAGRTTAACRLCGMACAIALASLVAIGNDRTTRSASRTNRAVCRPAAGRNRHRNRRHSNRGRIFRNRH